MAKFLPDSVHATKNKMLQATLATAEAAQWVCLARAGGGRRVARLARRAIIKRQKRPANILVAFAT